MGVNADLARWMYRGGRPNALARGMNAVGARVFATGRVGRRQATLEVRGRVSGETVRLPVVVAELGGDRYLVSMLGATANWVRNVEADARRAILASGERRKVLLQPVEVANRPAVIKQYLVVAPGARPHIPVDYRASESEFERVAPAVPVYRVVDAGPA
jgi:hypothetical protein